MIGPTSTFSAATGGPVDVTIYAQTIVQTTSGAVAYPDTGYTGTMMIATTDGAATGLPATYTFTSGQGPQFDNGQHTFAVIFKTAGLADDYVRR